jgi:hypothetical protein
VVAGASSIMIGSTPRLAFELMIAPRKLQSLSPSVQALAAAVSSVRSTISVIGSGISRLEVFETARGITADWLDEFEEAMGV